MRRFMLLISFITSFEVAANQNCSRVAEINYQEVLVDTSSNDLGEGLRYYLQKDEVAKKLLDEYQENNRPTWKSAFLSTIGSTMILFGILRTTSGEGETLTNKNTLIFGGASLVATSYLISQTSQYNNEWLLQKSVEEYNKRNTPRIFFSTGSPQGGSGLGLGIQKGF